MLSDSQCYVNMWLICLQQAMRRASRGAKDDCEWFEASEPDRPGGFEWICNSLDLNIDWLREVMRDVTNGLLQVDIKEDGRDYYLQNATINFRAPSVR